MFSGTYIPPVKLLVLGLFLSCSSILLAQRGGHIGGGLEGATGMGDNGKPTGLDVKDDLRGFHDVLAVQATREQSAAFLAMTQSTTSADAQLKALEAESGKEGEAVAGQWKSLQAAIENARDLNKKFLEGFSEQQKTGLREIIKRLAKTDLELAQQEKTLEQAAETKSLGGQISASLQNLDHALANFQHAQSDLGEEMSIPAAGRQASNFNLPPAKRTINLGDQTVTVTTSAIVSKTAVENGQNVFAVELSEDISDLQLNITDVLRLELNKSDRCGERIAIQSAELSPRAQAALVVAQLHYERWTCSPGFGRDSMNEIAEGNATVEVQLTPAVADDGTLKLVTQIGHVEAQGLIGDQLRSGALGLALRDKIGAAFAAILRQAGDFKSTLPEGARSYAALRHAEFQGTGSGKLKVQLNGDIRVPEGQVAALTSELTRASQEPIPGPLLTRPATPQEAVSR